MLYVIANPHAGTRSQTVSDVEQALKAENIAFRMQLVETPPEAVALIQKIPLTDNDDIAVFAGDGTVAAVAKAVANKSVNLLILPGGTANLLAHDAGLPTTITKCLEMYKSQRYSVAAMQLANAGTDEFILDMHFGFWAKTIVHTPRALKNLFGQFGYGLSAIRQYRHKQLHQFILEVNGRRVETNGYALFVANNGQQQFAGLPLFHQDKSSNLGVAILKSVSPWQLLKWMLRSKRKLETPAVIETFVSKDITIIKAPSPMIIDDSEAELSFPLRVQINAKSVRLITQRRTSAV